MPYFNLKSQISNLKLKYEGFSLAELLLAVALVGLVTAIALPNLRGFSNTQELNGAAAKLVDVLENAQSSASSHINCPDGVASSNWNVVLNTSTFVLNCFSVAASAVNQQVLTGSYKGDPSSTATFQISGACSGSTTLNLYFVGQQPSYNCGGIYMTTWPIRITLSGSGTTSTNIVIEQGGVIRIE